MATIGLEDVLLEACLTSCGSIKKYGRSLHCHKTLLECLDRLLFEQFLLCRNEDMVLVLQSVQKYYYSFLRVLGKNMWMCH